MPSLRTASPSKIAPRLPDDPLAVVLTARVPLRTLIQYGDICLATLVNRGDAKYRLTGSLDGKVVTLEVVGVAAFIEAAQTLGYKPWASDGDDSPEVVFQNAAGPIEVGDALAYCADPYWDHDGERFRSELYGEPTVQNFTAGAAGLH